MCWIPKLATPFATIKEKFGHLDIVFANAGIGDMGSMEETSEATFDEFLRTNVTGVFLTNHLRRRLRQDALLALTGAFRPNDIVGWRQK